MAACFNNKIIHQVNDLCLLFSIEPVKHPCRNQSANPPGFRFQMMKQVNLLFLDIKMPRISGIDFLKTLKSLQPVITTTAYQKFAIEGYDLELFDYLLKPITFDRFFKAIERYLRLNNQNMYLRL